MLRQVASDDLLLDLGVDLVIDGGAGLVVDEYLQVTASLTVYVQYIQLIQICQGENTFDMSSLSYNIDKPGKMRYIIFVQKA